MDTSSAGTVALNETPRLWSPTRMPSFLPFWEYPQAPVLLRTPLSLDPQVCVSAFCFSIVQIRWKYNSIPKIYLEANHFPARLAETRISNSGTRGPLPPLSGLLTPPRTSPWLLGDLPGQLPARGAYEALPPASAFLPGASSLLALPGIQAQPSVGYGSSRPPGGSALTAFKT